MKSRFLYFEKENSKQFLSSIVRFFLQSVIILTAFRLISIVHEIGKFDQYDQIYKIIINGFRIDLVVISYLFILLILATSIVSLLGEKIARFTIFQICMLFAVALVAMEYTGIFFLDEYGYRPNRIFFEYLVYPKTVLFTVAKTEPIAFTILCILPIISYYLFNKLNKNKMNFYFPLFNLFNPIIFVVLCALFFLGARGGIGKRPINISSVAFSNNHLVNELTLNSSYSLIYSVYRQKHEFNPESVYGKVSKESIIQYAKKRMALPEDVYVENKNPLMHKQEYSQPSTRKDNVVIILQESLGAEYVGSLQGLPLTPNLDKISKQGLYFTKLYSTGTRTVRGIEATIASFLPTPGTSVVKLEKARRDFFTGAALFKSLGYTTNFIYGGDSNFDEMRSFFLENGVENVFDLKTFDKAKFIGEWGASDEDLMDKTLEVMEEQASKGPFFTILLSTSNHSPFEFPENKITPYTEKIASRENAIKYADYAIGQFFEKARSKGFMKNTYFIIVGDHGTREFNNDLIPIKKFHIPALLLGPDVKPHHYNKLMSQIDLLPTLLGQMKLNTIHPMVGRDVLSLPKEEPGRAVMQYNETYGYRLGEDLVIMKPKTKPAFFKVNGYQLAPLNDVNENSEDLFHEAKAHALLPWMLYNERLYKLN